MSIWDEYEAEAAAKAKAEIAQEDALWAALTPEEQAQAIRDREAAAASEGDRQARIVQDHIDMFGEDEDDDEDEE